MYSDLRCWDLTWCSIWGTQVIYCGEPGSRLRALQNNLRINLGSDLNSSLQSCYPKLSTCCSYWRWTNQCWIEGQFEPWCSSGIASSFCCIWRQISIVCKLICMLIYWWGSYDADNNPAAALLWLAATQLLIPGFLRLGVCSQEAYNFEGIMRDK